MISNWATVMTPDEQAAMAEIELMLTHEPPTLREIAKRLGISKSTAQNIERRALAKLAKLARGWDP